MWRHAQDALSREPSPRRQRHGRICQHDPGHGARSFRLAFDRPGQAFQFECTLRQKDVIGEMGAAVRARRVGRHHPRQKWLRGIVWQEIDENLILRHVTSKKQKMTEVDLKLAPMVMEELQLMAGPSR
jgi:hypothetical protein